MSMINQSLPTPVSSRPETDSVGAYMNRTFFTLEAGMSVAAAQQHFLQQLQTDDIPSQVFIMEKARLCGVLSVKKLLQQADQTTLIRELMTASFFHVSPQDERAEVAPLLAKNTLDAVPVLAQGELVGMLGDKEIHRLMDDDVTEDAQRQGASLPLDTPYLDTSPVTLWKKRAVWLLLLFVAEAYTSTVLQAFEDQLEAVIALAFFIPLLIGTGGNSGTQITSTLVRSMALGEVSLRNLGAILRKELTTGLMIAVTIGLFAWVRAIIMGVGTEVTLVVSLTLVAIILWSAIVSSIIPMLLKKCGIDPAVVSAPFIATFIDGTGLIIYFEIAKFILDI
ncbi:magnesium transporter [Serratia sp. NPDC078593]|uniref:magnesium transporter n=1 Tax=unclassified Serratia (in: enterobacteria) TaxID=2647522 RepID=UPI0037D1E4A2